VVCVTFLAGIEPDRTQRAYSNKFFDEFVCTDECRKVDA
jgi:hypothetical protein